MSITPIIGLIVIAAITTILVLAARKPGTFRIERRQRIDAAPERIFPLINDLAEHVRWSPFDAPDPKTTKTCSTPSHGVGAEQSWSGTGKSGAGRFFITESVAPRQLTMSLQMTKPMRCNNQVAFTLTPVAAATDVTWAMSGEVSFLMKIFHVFCDMDAICGNEFEKGLLALKQIVESE